MGNAKDRIANAAIGLTAAAGFIGSLGDAPKATTNDLNDTHEKGQSRLQTSIGEYRGDNENGTSRNK